MQIWGLSKQQTGSGGSGDFWKQTGKVYGVRRAEPCQRRLNQGRR